MKILTDETDSARRIVLWSSLVCFGSSLANVLFDSTSLGCMIGFELAVFSLGSFPAKANCCSSC